MSFANLILLATALTTALIAGLFYAYFCSVNPGLSRLPDTEYLASMQAINLAIVNPVFLLSFLGPLLLLPLSTYLQFQISVSTRFWLLLAATILYYAGGFGVTVFGNIPLNDALAGLDLGAATPELVARERVKFENPWNRLHNLRTLACIVSFLLVIVACLEKGKQ